MPVRLFGQIQLANSNAPAGFLLNGGVYTTVTYPGSSNIGANGINDSGSIVGYYNDGFTGNGFLLSGGTYSSISYPGATRTSAVGINNSGQIVGDYDFGGAASYGFLLSGGTYTNIAFPGASITTVSGINNLGQIFGWYTSNFVLNGFLFSDGVYSTINLGITGEPLTGWDQ